MHVNTITKADAQRTPIPTASSSQRTPERTAPAHVGASTSTTAARRSAKRRLFDVAPSQGPGKALKFSEEQLGPMPSIHTEDAPPSTSTDLDLGPGQDLPEPERIRERFEYLTSRSTGAAVELRLPFHLHVLYAKFLALETVCMIQQHVRGETLTFNSARTAVERTCSK